jgi:chorismate mutase
VITALTQEKNSEILSMKEIDNLRKRINKVDIEIIELLAKRRVLTNKIGKIKRDLGITIIDKQRENDIYSKLKQYAKRHHLAPEYVTSIFRIIIRNSRDEQRNVTNGD